MDTKDFTSLKQCFFEKIDKSFSNAERLHVRQVLLQRN
jgi:hypothetical protein